MRNFYYFLFFLSGFSGLIFEHIWTQYLKLYLGHAAYAQVLVIGIFLGGLAIGSHLTAIYSRRLKNLLLLYALAEALLGLYALFFHPLYIFITDFSYNSILNNMNSGQFSHLIKWVTGVMMIFPQTILLGTSFPLLSSALVRLSKEHKGRIISNLYFVNCLGGSLGILFAGYYLIDNYGLPGTVIAGGIINLFIAFSIFYLHVKEKKPLYFFENIKKPLSSNTEKKDKIIFLACAALTGTASFIYEIGWLRMISLVVGNSVHSFELILSSFIFGLALGGFIIKFYIDKIRNTIVFLSFIQILMGLLASITIWFYNYSFDITAFLIKTLPKTDAGYFAYNISSVLISVFIIVPVTVCAGMTLPLITKILLNKGYAERSIGSVYAANTLGSIIGTGIAFYLLMPALGLKNMILCGSVIDVLTGLFILFYYSKLILKKRDYAALAFSGIALMFSFIFVKFDQYKMSSGVFRHGRMQTENDYILNFHKDGRTASIDVITTKNADTRTIISNGKPEAAVGGINKISGDEPTMILLSALPYIYKSDIENAAVIGMGSGLTSSTLLQFPGIKNVDTIEIEPAMVEGARYMGQKVIKIFTDKRSKIHIEDARTFLSVSQKKYDVIVSEPPNPWVSGASSLFSKEFYKLIEAKLSKGGIFSQWLHMYEINMPLIASIMKSLSANFKHYAIYYTDADMIILASNQGRLSLSANEFLEKYFSKKNIKKIFTSIGINNYNDLRFLYLGNKALLDPYFQSFNIDSQSDYYPVLDTRAVRARFLRENAFLLKNIPQITPSMANIFEKYRFEEHHLKYTSSMNFITDVKPLIALTFYDNYKKFLRKKDSSDLRWHHIDSKHRSAFNVLSQTFTECSIVNNEENWVNSLQLLMNLYISYLPKEQVAGIIFDIENSRCFSKFSEYSKSWLYLYKSIYLRNFIEMNRISGSLIPTGRIPDRKSFIYPIYIGMLSNAMLNEHEKVIDYYDRLSFLEIPVQFEILKAFSMKSLYRNIP
ncbi:MAG: hypothetical protein OEZ13_10300 [Spirochaetia bacterium]|nr:hypothetical protein [Spirochaetia bacterium]